MACSVSLTGKPVFLDDVVPDNALVVKVKRSPYAHALIEEIKIDTALKVPGIEAIYTYKDVPNIRSRWLARLSEPVPMTA